MKLSNEDKDDLLKYAKYFALKASQIIVSSRQKKNDGKATPCRQKSDWFNLNIAAIDDSDANTIKQTVSNKFLRGIPVSLEIYAESPDGELLVEIWCISLSSEHSDPNPKIPMFNVYNQIGILLKSLLSVTRVLPAYRLSLMKKEICDTHYRIFEGEPDFDGLEEECKHITIGRILSPIGTLQVTVDYKPKIIIQASKAPSPGSSLIYDSKYLCSNNKELNIKCSKNHQGDEKFGRYTIPFAIDCYPAPIRRTKPALQPGGVPWYPKSYQDKNYFSTCEEKHIQEINSTQKLNKTENSSPTDNLELKVIEPDTNNSQDLCSSGKYMSSEYNMISVMSKYRARSVPKCVYFPFANGTRESEISNFYRECSNPPILTCWKQSTSVKDIDLAEQLNAFEEKIKEFDDLENSLSASPDSDN